MYGHRILFLLLKSYFDLVDYRGYLHDSINYTIMIWFLGALWGLVCRYIIWAFEFITRYSFRNRRSENCRTIDSDCDVVHELEDDHVVPNISNEPEFIGFFETESHEIDLGLKSWTVKDRNKSFGETESSDFMESSSTVSTSKYMFMPGNNVSGFMEEPIVLTFKFTVHEVGLESNDDLYSQSTTIDSTGKDFGEHNFGIEDVNQEKTEDSAEINNSAEVLVGEKDEIDRVSQVIDETCQSENDSLPISSDDGMFIEMHKMDSTDEDLSSGSITSREFKGVSVKISDETRDESENDSMSISPDDGMFIEMHKMDSTDEDLSSGSITGREIVGESFKIFDETNDESKNEIEDVHHENTEDTAEINTDIEGLVSEEQENNRALIDEIEIAVLEIDHVYENGQFDKIDSETFQTSSDSPSMEGISNDEINSTDDSLSNSNINKEKEDHSSETITKDHEMVSEDKFTALEKPTPKDISEKSEEPKLEEEVPPISKSEDEVGFEVVDAHQDYIKQLKNELKQGKNIGLPTIHEESEESPRISEDMKPMIINTKMEHKDAIQEIHKVYKTYAHKMQKLDVLANQTMHAIDLLKLRDPTHELSFTKKSATPVLKSLLSQKFRLSKVRNEDNKTNKMFIKELQKDFELVYIGQVCLSWEILHWQHMKVQELQNFNPHAFRQYNHVADLYQQFQVMLQRFIEDEPFQKRSRIENYIDHRCALRGFLQVPLVKDACTKDKMPKQEGEYAISIRMLTVISKESIHLFWDFIRADKDGANGTHVDLKDDLELLMDIKTNYQKKDKKLKEALRSKSCIVKRLQRNKEDEMNPRLLYAQMELKLVGKVLNMSKLTRDQLVWCHKKIEEINFSSRNICTPSFLLFPC